MAKIKALDNAIVLVSDLTEEEIVKASKFCPNTLKLVDEDKNPYFVVQLGSASIGTFGVSFERKTPNDNAVLTILAEKSVTREEVIESFAETLFNLNEVENQIKKGLEELGDKINSVADSIEIVE